MFAPESALVGDEGNAWTQVMAGLNGERLVCAAQGLGMAQRTFDDLMAYVSEREQFGAPIGSFQALRHQMMGGYGYSTEFDMERHLRLSIAPTIYAGTNEIQRDIISSTFRPASGAA